MDSTDSETLHIFVCSAFSGRFNDTPVCACVYSGLHVFPFLDTLLSLGPGVKCICEKWGEKFVKTSNLVNFKLDFFILIG